MLGPMRRTCLARNVAHYLSSCPITFLTLLFLRSWSQARNEKRLSRKITKEKAAIEVELSSFDSCENPLFHKIRTRSAEGKTTRGLEVGLSRRRAGSTDLDTNEEDIGLHGGSTRSLAGLESCTVDNAGYSDGDGSDDDGGVANAVNVDLSVVADTQNNDHDASQHDEDSGEDGQQDDAVDCGDVVDCQNHIDETGAEEQPQEEEPTLHRDAESGRRYSHNTRSGESVWVDAEETKSATVKAAPAKRFEIRKKSFDKRFESRKKSFDQPTSATGAFLAGRQNWTQHQARRARRGPAQLQTLHQVAGGQIQIETPVSQETGTDLRDDSGRAGSIEI